MDPGSKLVLLHFPLPLSGSGVRNHMETDAAYRAPTPDRRDLMERLEHPENAGARTNNVGDYHYVLAGALLTH